MGKKLIESHFKLFRKTIQLYNFYKNIKEKGKSKGVIDTESIEKIIQEAREVNKSFSEFPESEKLKPQREIFRRDECVFQYCPNPTLCQNKCINS